jgi:hypothetical protein
MGAVPSYERSAETSETICYQLHRLVLLTSLAVPLKKMRQDGSGGGYRFLSKYAGAWRRTMARHSDKWSAVCGLGRRERMCSARSTRFSSLPIRNECA